MPRSRKRSADGQSSSASSVSGIIASGGGTASSVRNLARQLNLSYDATLAIMNCNGQGVARSSRRGGGDDAAGASGGAGAMDPAMMNVWGDFMSEEMDSAPAAASSSSAPAPAAAAPAAAESAKPSPAAAAASSASDAASSGPRSYVLPIQPRMRLSTGKKGKGGDEEEYAVPTPGLLAQTGTLDASV